MCPHHQREGERRQPEGLEVHPRRAGTCEDLAPLRHLLNLQSRTAATAAPASTAPRATVMHRALLASGESGGGGAHNGVTKFLSSYTPKFYVLLLRVQHVRPNFLYT